jgi:glutamate synthase domain-containing protein 2
VFKRLMTKMMMGMMNNITDHMMNRMMQDPYTENMFSMVTIMQKLTPRAIIEAGMRAESGKPIERPLGSPIVLSDWHKLLLNPVHLFRLPTADGVQIQTSTTIGPRARKPLHLEIPILITGMSYGGALSLKAKIALAKAATMAGTASNSGEAPLIDEERKEAKFFIGQI